MSIITDEMVDKATQAWLEEASDYTRLHQSVRAALAVVLPDILEAAAKVAEEELAPMSCTCQFYVGRAIRALAVQNPGE